VDTRISRLQGRIDRGRDERTLSRREARDAQRTLNDIRREESARRGDGYLSSRDEALLQQRLDRLSAQIRYDREG